MEARGNMKLLMVDLDGTIREPFSGEKFISCPTDQKIIDKADRAIATKLWLLVTVPRFLSHILRLRVLLPIPLDCSSSICPCHRPSI